MYDDEPIGYDGYGAPLYRWQVTPDQARRHSPGVRFLIGVAIIDGALSVAIVAWNVVDRVLDRLRGRT